MNVQQLRDLLSQMDPGDEVRIATQPNYPLAFHVAGVATGTGERNDLWCHACDGQVELRTVYGSLEAHHLNPAEDADHQPELGDDGTPDDGLELGIVWIVTGDHPDQPYAPRAAFAVAEGWL